MTDHANPDAVIASIDNALRDYDLGPDCPDAMRWVPPTDDLDDAPAGQIPASRPSGSSTATWAHSGSRTSSAASCAGSTGTPRSPTRCSEGA